MKSKLHIQGQLLLVCLRTHDANAAPSAAERKDANVTALRESLCGDDSDTIEMRFPVTEPVKRPERCTKRAASTKTPQWW